MEAKLTSRYLQVSLPYSRQKVRYRVVLTVDVDLLRQRTFALMTAVKAYQAAEGQYQWSYPVRSRIHELAGKESSMEEVKQAIRSVPWLDDYFDIGEIHQDKEPQGQLCILRSSP